jgi:hypothetical protein
MRHRGIIFYKVNLNEISLFQLQPHHQLFIHLFPIHPAMNPAMASRADGAHPLRVIGAFVG